ncbi:MAG: FHA domain-containing protein [Anaerolineae bacterium]
MSDKRSMGPNLVIRHTGQVFPLTRAPLTIGRDEENTIVLADPRASDQHAMVYWQAGGYVIQDMGSASGTYVNERRISSPQPLRDGYVVRLGNTLFDAHIPAAMGAPAGYVEAAGEPGRSRRGLVVGLLVAAIVVLVGVIIALLVFWGNRADQPRAVIESPAEGTQFAVAEEVMFRATASGAEDIIRLELTVDNILVGMSTSPNTDGSDFLALDLPWTFAQAGPHTISALAYTAAGKVSDTASVSVAVVETMAEVTPTATEGVTDTPEPTSPGDTATPTPTSSDTPTPTLTPTPTATGAPPQISSFEANPSTIIAGDCTTLEWGAVTNATQVTIDQGIGGVGTPGNTTVCPGSTTTYQMTATGPDGTTTASVTVTVEPGSPDLTVDSIEFVPMPPVRGNDNEVRITIHNIGTAAAGAFDWEWQPGTAVARVGSLPGLNAGQSQVVTLIWNPSSWYGSLPTRARVDTGGAVAESDETNNELQVNVEVVRPPDVTVTLQSQAALDGFQANNGGGNNSVEIRVGNGPFVGSPAYELVNRGFMSFDLSGIPAAAEIRSIELAFYQVQVVGTPYTKLGNPLLKHLDYGGSLENSDYDAAVLASAILAPRTGSGEWYQITSNTLANWIEEDLRAGRTRFQLRLQFNTETDGDGNDDRIMLESADNSFGTGNVPQLTITYAP